MKRRVTNRAVDQVRAWIAEDVAAAAGEGVELHAARAGAMADALYALGLMSAVEWAAIRRGARR